MKFNHVPAIEQLEARIAPAAVFVNATTATYDDNDGDHVTVKFTKPVLTAANTPNVFSFNAAGYLSLLDLTAAASPAATDVSFSVVKFPAGDGVVNVGLIKGAGFDLGAIKVPGDLGAIVCGDATTSTPGLKLLAVHSLGMLGTDTGSNLQSAVHGALTTLAVKSSVQGAWIDVTGGADGKIGKVTIGGSLLGGTTARSGSISTTGNIGPVKIGRDIVGGSGGDSGEIASGGSLASVKVGGSVLGGSASQNSGYISSVGDMGAVTIAHDVTGGAGGSASGEIYANGKLTSITVGGSLIGGVTTIAGGDQSGIIAGTDIGMVKIGHDIVGRSSSNSAQIFGDSIASVTVGGSVLGGTATNTGGIYGNGNVGPVKIRHNLVGGSIAGTTATLDASGFILSFSGHIASVTIGGDIVSGMDSSSAGSLVRNATIRAHDDLGALTVLGSIVGNSTSPVIISGGAQQAPIGLTDTAIGKIRVGGLVESAQILGGFDYNGLAVNGDAQIGAVKVGGDWLASDIIAGAKNLGADDAVGGNGLNADNVNFGDQHDASIGAGVTGIFSKIASITIAGQVFGTPTNVNSFDHFGFVAEEIGALKIGAIAITLTAGQHNDTHLVGQTIADMHVNEI